MYILLVGFNHKTAPLSVREAFAFTEKRRMELYAAFRESSKLHSLMILSTCNRTELYAVTRDTEAGISWLYDVLAAQVGGDRQKMLPYVYTQTCDDAVLHLYRVASGLDSMILGETQILGQLKQAYAEAKAHQASCRIMNQLMQKAFAVGKKVRASTAIDQHPVSVSYIAVEQAKIKSGGLIGKKVLVVGAGEAGKLTARYLKEEGVQAVFLSNRSMDTAQKLAQDLGGEAVRFDALPEYLKQVDIVISCTGASHFVIHGEACKRALQDRQGKPIVFIDIAVPRDVDPDFACIQGVQLLDMDKLQDIVWQQQQQREQAAVAGEVIVQEEIAAFRAWCAALHVTPAITALKQRGEEIRVQELQRAFNRLEASHVGEREKKVIMEMGQAIVNQLLRQPVERLKQLAEQGEGEAYAFYVKTLFDLPALGEEEAHGNGDKA